MNEQNSNKLPFYYRIWFITILFLIAPVTLYITALLAAGLMVQFRRDFLMLSGDLAIKFKEFEDSKVTADEIKQEANVYKENIIKETDDYKQEIENSLISSKEKKEEIDLYIAEKADQALFAQTTVNFTEGVTSNEIKNKLSMLQLDEKQLIKEGLAVLDSGQNTKTSFNKQSKQLLRAFNSEADYYLSNVTIKNVDNFRNKIAKAFETLNKMFEIDNVKLNQELLTSKLKQLDIMYQYQKQVEIEKELLKAQKEEIREQQKAEKEIQDQKRKIEKEEQQFNNEMNKLLKYLNAANNEVEQNIYADKIKELEEKLKLLEKDKQNVLERETNTRAGYVYIISNIGSFGENVYKIGMTRRLEPMDRINELGSASVPFPFDVHALIFSDDAPRLENTLHNYFRNNEVNKVNTRKEFFKVDLQEVKNVVLKEHNNTVHFTDLAVAEQYYESIKQDIAV
ncbi:DUF4041 domain-containing protein [Streptococcus parauberis]|uniref:DUF4041 domain-containing protein n=1 Tax=Streptococcus parauberis TaxID=1348 RepID=UPI0037A60D60